MDNTLSKTSFHLILAQKMGNTFTKCKHKCISSYNSTLNLKFESLKVNSWCDHIYFSTVWTLCLMFSAGIVPQTSWTTSQRSSLDVSCLVLHSLTTRIMLRSRLWGDSPQRLVVCFSIRAFTAHTASVFTVIVILKNKAVSSQTLWTFLHSHFHFQCR